MERLRKFLTHSKGYLIFFSGEVLNSLWRSPDFFVEMLHDFFMRLCDFCVVRLLDFFVWRGSVSFCEERLRDVFG